MTKTNTRPVYRAPSGPWVSGERSGPWRLPRAPPPGLLTEVEVASLVLGLEEAPSGLSMDVGSLGHEQLHVMFAAALDGDVEGGLTWGGHGRTVTCGSRRDQTGLGGGEVQRVEIGATAGGAASQSPAGFTPGQQWAFRQTFSDVASSVPESLHLLSVVQAELGAQRVSDL